MDQNYENCIDVLKVINKDLENINKKLPRVREIKNDNPIVGGSIDTRVEFQSV